MNKEKNIWQKPAKNGCQFKFIEAVSKYMEPSIKKIIREFLPKAEPKIISTHEGEINRVVLFSDSGKEFALRIKKKPFSEESLIFEKEFLDDLSVISLPVTVPDIFPDKSGSFFVEDEDNFYSLMSRVPGRQRFEKWYESHLFSAEDVRQGFHLLGSLHNAYREIHIEDRKKSPSVFRLLDQFEKRFNEPDIAEGVLHRKILEENKFLSQKITQIRKDLEDSGYKDLPIFSVHYDINYTNVFWEDEKIVSLIDFDWAQFSTLEFDFAQMCKLTCGSFAIVGNSNLFDESRLKMAIEAYNERSEIKLQDNNLLRTLLDVSSLFLAHWALDTFSREQADEEYYAYFFQAGIDRLHQEISL
jgi:Ser/Thr protein kinase RdoA (MazF antagonist)